MGGGEEWRGEQERWPACLGKVALLLLRYCLWRGAESRAAARQLLSHVERERTVTSDTYAHIMRITHTHTKPLISVKLQLISFEISQFHLGLSDF